MLFFVTADGAQHRGQRPGGWLPGHKLAEGNLALEYPQFGVLCGPPLQPLTVYRPEDLAHTLIAVRCLMAYRSHRHSMECMGFRR